MILQDGGEVGCREIAEAGPDCFECSTTILGPFIIHCAMDTNLLLGAKMVTLPNAFMVFRWLVAFKAP